MGSERSFGLVFGAVFALVALWPVLGGIPVRWWALALAIALLAVSFTIPGLFKPFNRLWFAFGLLLGKVIAPLVMGLVFFLAVTPTALLARLMGKDFLLTSAKVKARESFWIDREKDPDHPSSMKDQF